MKKCFALMLVLMLLVSMAAPIKAAATTVATEAPTKPPVSNKILQPTMPEVLPTAIYYATLELVDDQTIRFNMYNEPLYKTEEVLALQPGDGILLAGEEYCIEQVQLISHEYPKLGTRQCVRLTHKDGTICLVQKAIIDSSVGITGWGDFLPTDGEKTYVLDFSHSVEGNVKNISMGDFLASEDGLTYVERTGKEVVEMLKTQPELFTLEDVMVLVYNGQVVSMQLGIAH